MSARASSGAMTNTPAPMAPFTHDLEANSRGHSGRQLMKVIQANGLSTRGYSRPIDLGTTLQSESPETDELVGHYLEVAAHEHQLVSLVMVAVTPVVMKTASRSVGVSVTEEFGAELRCQLLEHLPSVVEVPASLRRTHLAQLAVGAARRVTRVPACRPEFVVLDDVHDRVEAAPHVTDRDRLVDLLETVFASVVTVDEARIIRASRCGEKKICELAEELGTTHKALLQRRSRAEAKVRAAISMGVGR